MISTDRTSAEVARSCLSMVAESTRRCDYPIEGRFGVNVLRVSYNKAAPLDNVAAVVLVCAA